MWAKGGLFNVTTGYALQGLSLVVTACTLFYCYLYICPTQFICVFRRDSRYRTVIIPPHIIKQFAFVIEDQCVYWEVGNEF